MKIQVLWIVFLGWGMAASVEAEDASFRFSRDVKAPLLKQEELLAITLDADIFAASQEDLADVRLRDAKGEFIPYLLRKRQTTQGRSVRTTWPARNPAARPLDDGGLEITVHLDEDAKHSRPTGLTIITPLRNFKQRVRVSTSADGARWEPAGEGSVIFDYSRYMDVRSDSVFFPESDRRHFRIVIDNVTVEQESELLALTRRLQGAKEIDRTEQATIDRRPFRIERVDFWRDEQQERVTGDEKAPYAMTEFRATEDQEKRRTIIVVETRRQPLIALQLETPDRNFSRHAVVEVEMVQGVTKRWQPIGATTLSRVEFKDRKREELSISFPESRHARYRVVIDNRDSPPLTVGGIKAEGNVYEILYLAAPGRRDQLIYGAVDAQRATYDTSVLQELLGSGFQPARAELGAENPIAIGEPPFRWSRLFGNTLFLGGVVALLVIALGFGLFRAVRRIDNLPGNSTPQGD
jgi:Protein of unknown function (DUF3999)